MQIQNSTSNDTIQYDNLSSTKSDALKMAKMIKKGVAIRRRAATTEPFEISTSSSHHNLNCETYCRFAPVTNRTIDFDDDPSNVLEQHTDPEGHKKNPNDFTYMKETINQLLGFSNSYSCLSNRSCNPDENDEQDDETTVPSEFVPSLLSFEYNSATIEHITFPLIPKKLQLDDTQNTSKIASLVMRFKNMEQCKDFSTLKLLIFFFWFSS